MDLNQWTVLAIVSCLTSIKNPTETFQSEWLILVFSTEMNWRVLWQDLPESEDSNRMMLTFSACPIKSKWKSLEFLTSLITFTLSLASNTKSNFQPDLRNIWVNLKIGKLPNLNLKTLSTSSEKNTKSTKEMELSMAQKSILNFLILSEDNINVEPVNLTSNFQLDSTFNTELNKLKKKNPNKKRKIKRKNKKSNWLQKKLNKERNRLLKRRRIRNKNQRNKRSNKKSMKLEIKTDVNIYIENIHAILSMTTAIKISIWLPLKKVFF